jgi:hypothetical protein
MVLAVWQSYWPCMKLGFHALATLWLVSGRRRRIVDADDDQTTQTGLDP